MHVLYFHQHFTTPMGSDGTRSYEMARALIREGHTVTLVCGSNSRAETGLFGNFSSGKRRGFLDDIDVIEFDLNYSNHMNFRKRSLVFLKFAFNSIILALREPADVIFSSSTPLTAGIPGVFARWVFRKTFVFEVRDLWPELPKKMGVIKNPIILNLLSLLEWITYHSAHRIIALSPGMLNGINIRGIDRSNILMIPNGCDVDFFGINHETQRPVSVPNENFLAIYAGTHGRANGLHNLLDAAIILEEQGRSDISIVMIGDGSEKKSLMDRAQKLNLKSVIFIDFMSKMDLRKLFYNADIGLQLLENIPAFYNGTSPNKFFDYISAGLPVINNYPGWVAELIENENCGYAVPPDDQLALANALVKAEKNRDELKNLGLNARKLGMEKFHRHDLAKRWVEWVVKE